MGYKGDKFRQPGGKSLVKQYKAWQKGASAAEKNFASESMGESNSHIVATEKYGMKTVLHPDTKGTRHYFDSAYTDKEGRLVVVEAKGGGSKLSKAQKNPNWITETSKKVLAGAKGYEKASPHEKAVAKNVMERHANGEAIGLLEVKTRVGAVGMYSRALVRYFSQGKHVGTVGGPVTTKAGSIGGGTPPPTHHGTGIAQPTVKFFGGGKH